ncbi:TPA: hypothetical protein DDW35_11705 [Candidatus Sumerlaeota bacterium]|jgi:hypothetical protein|nr:hypothetical protein [Candidatus Sumerlaeota bacterium]
MKPLDTIQAGLALRDALLQASAWEEVEPLLEKRGMPLSVVRERLKPRVPFDPHNHTMYSDGLFSCTQLVWWCKAVGLRGIGITDHDNIHPELADAIDEGERLGVRVAPGMEFTLNRVGGQTWKGLELNVHFFPPKDFATFLRSEDGAAFCKRFEAANKMKTEQAWATLERVNARWIPELGLTPIAREELFDMSGRVDPVCPSTITVLVMERMFKGQRNDLLSRFPDTRSLYTHMHTHDLIPPLETGPRTIDDLAEMLDELRKHGIRSVATINHPEECMTKGKMVLPSGAPDREAFLRLFTLIRLHDPLRVPIAFLETYTARNTPTTRWFLSELLGDLESMREQYFTSIPEIMPIASSDSHRVTGYLDENNQVQGWPMGEDFIFGIGKVNTENPSGNVEIPLDYPDTDTILEIMNKAAR